jgi:RNA polymerase sigma-70 factor (ECF subfamily)
MPDGGFEQWYRREHPVVIRALLVACGDPDLAAETAAEAFVRALERWPQVADMTSPGGWVCRVGFNLLARRRRCLAVENRLGFRSAQPADAPADEPDVDLWRAVQALPPRMRQAIALRYVMGLSEDEVAQVMGTSTGSASATLSSARRKLEQRLGLVEDSEVTNA